MNKLDFVAQFILKQSLKRLQLRGEKNICWCHLHCIYQSLLHFGKHHCFLEIIK